VEKERWGAGKVAGTQVEALSSFVCRVKQGIVVQAARESCLECGFDGSDARLFVFGDEEIGIDGNVGGLVEADGDEQG
jgi:hypothetical protein